MNPPADLNLLGSVSMDIVVTLQVDGAINQLTLKTDAICDAYLWENEVIWQAARGIANKQGKEVALEALEAVVEKIKSS